MASIISAGTTSGTSLNLSGDTSGVLQLASNGSTTAVTIDTNQRAAFVAGTAALPAITTTGDTNTGVWFPAADTVAASTGGTERMRIDSSGNVLVGRTTNTVGAKMCVDGDAGLSIERDSNGYRRMTMTSSIMYFYNGTNEATLTSAGAWTNASDARLKKNITDIQYGLNIVLQTQPRSFERIDVDGKYIGFIAQELKEKIPEVVFGDENRQYSVDYGSLVAVAFKAIQELSASVDTLNAKVEAQAVRIAELEGAK